MVTKMKFAREMMKKSFFIVLSVILCVLCLPITVKADEPDNTKYSAGNFYYHVHEGYVSICGYVGDDTEIIIPSNIAGSPVSEIESKAFDGCDNLVERTYAKQNMQILFGGLDAWETAYKEMKKLGYFKDVQPQVILNNPQFDSLYEVKGNQKVIIGKNI